MDSSPDSSQPDSSMTKFLSFLSHDLRSGLNGAVLMLEVIKRQLAGKDDFKPVLEDVETVRRSILETVATMERFLHAEKLRYGRMPVHLMEVDVGQLLEKIEKDCSPLLVDREVKLEKKIEPGLKITSDKDLLTMVLQNLISNAAKFSLKNSVRVTVEKSTQGCRFVVTDHGRGIAPEKMAEIFKPYVSGETYGQKGMGLGLYIARHAAELLNGKLWAESKVGEGSSFYFELPV